MTFWLGCLLALLLSACSVSETREEAEYQYTEDLKDKRVAVLSGSTGDTDLNKWYPDMRLSRYESAGDLIQAIKYGRCDAIGIDGFMAGYLNATIGGGLVPLDDAVDHLDLAAAFPKNGNLDLRRQFNAFLKESKRNGTLEKIVDKWINHSVTAELTPLVLPTEGDPIIVGVCSMVPPVGYSKNGQLVGLDIEITRYFSQFIGRPVEFLGSNTTSLFTSLIAGKTDMVLAGLSITEERKTAVDFSDSYLNYPEILYVLEKNKKGFTKKKKENGTIVQYQFVNDVVNEPMGVVSGSPLEEDLRQEYESVHFQRYQSELELIAALRRGDCQSILVEDFVFQFLNHEVNDLARLDNTLGKRELGAVFHRFHNRNLRKQFNAFIQEMRQNGMHARIMDKWMNHATTAELPNLDLPKEGKPIRVVTSSSVGPTSFLREGQLVGCDIELMMYFSLYANRPIVIEDVKLSSLESAVMKRKADMAINGITISKDVKKLLTFSEPYWTYETVVAVNQVNKLGYQELQADSYLADNTDWTSHIEHRFTKNLMYEARYLLVLKGIGVTLVIAFFSGIFGTILGAFLCWLRLRKEPFLHWIAKFYNLIFKGTPVLVLLLFMFYVTFNHVNIHPLSVAIITFTLNFSAIVSTIFRVAITNVDSGQTDAAISLGFTRFRSFIHIVMPQAFKQALPLYKNEVVSMIKATSIVGYIALEDLTKVSDIIAARTFDALFPLIMASALYFALSWIVIKLIDACSDRWLKDLNE